MKKGATIALIVLIAASCGFYGFKRYKQASEQALADQRLAADKAEQTRLQAEAVKRAEAEAEDHRLAALKAQKEAEQTALELQKLRADQAATEAARLAAEKEVAAAEAERARLAKEKEALEGEARRLAEQREKEAAIADAARRDALLKLAEVEQQKRELADREASRLASLKTQQAMEEQTVKRILLNKSILPPDYKRRDHYYMKIDLMNAAPLPAPATPAK